MRLEPGDLVLVPFPFTDLTAIKTRPAFVLSSREFNDAGQDVILCGVTSNLANADWSVLIGDRDLVTGRLPVPSRVKVAKVVALKKTILRKKIGRLKPSVMARVYREFYALFPNE